AFLRHIPNMTIMMPKDENEGQHMVKTAIEYDGGPIALRYPRGNGIGVPLDDELVALPIGSWEVLREGKDGSILTFGTTIPMAMQAADMLAQQGIDIEVVNARFIKPMDEDMLHRILSNHKPILTIEEAVLKGGFGSGVLEFAHDHGYLHAIVDRMGIPDQYIEHGNVDQLLEEIHMTAEDAAARMQVLLQQKQQVGLNK
ncbi:MAG: 1-deoxy-D-xylulose-5-phosphate synthase, partial [Lysinibacillus fusiformis]|nr:1-deoxy-D-xylulose-5-phosphate synthase [Lysinibacillus fusiformis]